MVFVFFLLAREGTRLSLPVKLISRSLLYF